MPDVELVCTRLRARRTPAWCWSRQYAAAHRVGAAWPFMWTRTTSSKSNSDMLTIVVSRRIPALLTTMSRSPYDSTASSTTERAPSQLAMSWSLLTAMPPRALISAATSEAGCGSSPMPSLATPRSLTTTATPCSASSSACSRPSPRPAPVTTATRPSSSTMTRRRVLRRLQSREFHDGAPPVRVAHLRRLAFDRHALDGALRVAEGEHWLEPRRCEDRRGLLVGRRCRDVGKDDDVGSTRHDDRHVAAARHLGALRHALADDRAEREVVAEHLLAFTQGQLQVGQLGGRIGDGQTDDVGHHARGGG